jgi:hypothetical protein
LKYSGMGCGPLQKDLPTACAEQWIFSFWTTGDICCCCDHLMSLIASISAVLKNPARMFQFND